jgi:hypothetical protein
VHIRRRFIKQKIVCTLQRVSGAGSGVAPPAVTLEIPADQLPARNVVRAQVRACSLDSLIVCDVLMGWFVRDLDLHPRHLSNIVKHSISRIDW